MTQTQIESTYARTDGGGLPLDETRVSCGDLLIAFGARGPVATGRAPGEEWECEADDPNWRVLTQGKSRSWQGYPLVTIRTRAGRGWLLGELYGLGNEGQFAAQRVAEDVVEGRRGADTLNGHFLLLFWDAVRRRWHVWTDRFGTFHAYHGSDGRRAAIGTFFPAVAGSASSRQLDWIGISGFFTQGFFPQDRTYFEDVRILRPASHYIYDADGRLVSRERYWQWRHEPDGLRSYDETVDEFARLWREVMTDQLSGGRIAVPISGGLDSRTTVAPDLSGYVSPSSLWAYSYGYTKDSVETGIARRVAAARGLPFHPFTVGPYLFERLGLVLDSVEGFQDITQCRQGAVVDEIGRNADYLIAAHWGDVWMDTMGLMSDEHKGQGDGHVVEHTIHKMEKNGRAWLLENVSGPRSQDSAAPDLQEAVREEMATLAHVECDDFRVKAFKTDNWSFRWTMTSLRMFQPAAFPRLPFYDTRLTDFFCTVPSAFVHRRRLQVDYLKRFAPDLARVTWQAYDADLYNYQHFKSWLLPKRIYKKARRLMSRREPIQRNWEVQFLNAEGRAGLERWLLRTGLKLHEFASPSAVKALLDEFRITPTAQGRGYTVPMLLTFSTWLERYG